VKPEAVRAPNKLVFFVRRDGASVHASQVDGDLDAEAASLDELRTTLRAAIEAQYGIDRPISLLVGAKTEWDAAPGARTTAPAYARMAPQTTEGEFVMLAQPPPQYAGQLGARATISSVSKQHVFVVFESGIRESFPARVFSEYFTAASPAELASRPLSAKAR
jgi:hypothetical protein